MGQYNLLKKIKTPADVKKLSDAELDKLCAEIRAKLVETVAENGGHLSSNLGCVELTVALHRAFNSPDDQIIWDVGHQCYTHKLLTGRYDSFNTLRKEGGISGFTNPAESKHDIFYSGHSSTSISAAYGLAQAKKIKGEKGYVIAVIGDGSMTGGEAYEGLNNAYANSDNLIIIVNDNQMSISKNKSSFAKLLAEIRSTSKYYRSKKVIERIILHIPFIGRALRNRIVKYKYALKSVLYHSSFFDDLGYAYFGPVDGHNIQKLDELFEVAKLSRKASVIHVDTIKGRGYLPAEIDPTFYHGVGSFDIKTGKPLSDSMNFSKAFSEAICGFARKDKRVCAVTAAMPSGTGLEEFAYEFKNRYFDVGIAEQHAVTFSSGLAKNGLLPVFAVYSTFLQRAYDQLIHDISLQGVKVIFAVDRAGFVGSDGQTHQGLFDISMLNSVPYISIFAPSTYDELNHMMFRALYKENGSCAIRYPRGGEYPLPDNYVEADEDYCVYNDCEKKKNIIVTFGRLFSFACGAADRLKEQNIDAAVLKLNKIKPISQGALDYALKYKKIYFYEEGIRAGGVGEQFAIMLSQKKFKGTFSLKAVSETFVKPAETAAQLREYGLDCISMMKDLGAEIE